MGNDSVSPVISPSKFQHILCDVAKSQKQAKPNPQAEKQKLLSLLVAMSTLVVNFFNHYFIKFNNFELCEFEKPGQPAPGFSIS